MSQFKLAMKKDSMKKNKKLVINIAPNKEGQGLPSRLGTDQGLGSSTVEKDRFESESQTKRYASKVCSKAGEIDGYVDDNSSFRDRMMREVDVGTGLWGALNRLREQGNFKGESKDNHEGDRFRHACKDIQIQRVDKWGRILTQKEAYRAMCHGFHGKQPGKRKQAKRKKMQEDKSKQMESSERAVERMREVHALLRSPYIDLSSHKLLFN